MQIKDIFSRDIDRDIKEVIKVDEKSSILDEVEEYVATEHITDQLLSVLDKYQETVLQPSDEINLWVSGFFGSGKSSFAKVLGYLLSNAQAGDTTVAERFFALNESPKAKALLTHIHLHAPTEAVLLDLNTAQTAFADGESIVLTIYRRLLGSLDYSTDLSLSELEFALEQTKELAAFKDKYAKVYSVSWESRRNVILAKNEASRVLHELDPQTYPAADSWAKTATPPPVSAKWFATRAMELLRRRRPNKKRLILIVDEVGQYVASSTDRMRDLQGLAEECQKTRGALWLLATSQEKLTDIVDGLDGKKTEFAKAKDRFPIRVDLLSSDIDEVTGKRILDKTTEGETQIRQVLGDHRPKLATAVNLDSPRNLPFSDQDFVRLYPLVPYQLEVLIDAVTVRHKQGGASQTLGGSNRTILRHAQQLLSHEQVGLKDAKVGALVTLDRSYELLEDVVAPAWKNEVKKVSKEHGSESFEAKVMRVVALCTGMPWLPLNVRNIAALLHPSMSANPLDKPVEVALGNLVDELRLREVDGCFAMQNPEQKTWAQTRQGLDMKPADAARLSKEIFRDELNALTVKSAKNKTGRTFKVQVQVENETLHAGDIILGFHRTTDLHLLEIASHPDEAKNHIAWTYSRSEETWEALLEWHRSVEMISKFDNPNQTDAQQQLLTEERLHLDAGRDRAARLLAADLAAGQTIFQGLTDLAPSGQLRTAAENLVSESLPTIYPHLSTFAGVFSKADITKILRADTLDGLPTAVGPDGLGLFRLTKKGREFITDQGPIEAVVTFIAGQEQYGEQLSGGQLQSHFEAPPYGATLEALQAVLAGAMRAGLLEVFAQAVRITSAGDQRLAEVFGKANRFKAATFKLADATGPSLDERARVVEWLQEFMGTKVGVNLGDLALAGREVGAGLYKPFIAAKGALDGARLAVSPPIVALEELFVLLEGDDRTVVSTLHDRGPDLVAGRQALQKLKGLIEDNLSPLRDAQEAVKLGAILDEEALAQASAGLQQVLDKADYGTDLARIKSLTTKIEDGARAVTEQTKSALSDVVTAEVSKLRSTYDTVKDADFATAVEPLVKLNQASELGVLRNNVKAVPYEVSKAAEKLSGLSTNQNVRHVKAAEVWSKPIRNEAELDTALALLRQAVLEQLNDETEVRFR